MTIKPFTFRDESAAVVRELASILGRITHHIHPDVVNHIAETNVGYQSVFGNICHGKLNTSAFFYPNSDCVFPGFRRPINKEKSGQWKNKVHSADGTILNDNTFPRHIWACLSAGKAYSGGQAGMWSSSGLDKFELAHVFGHKPDERELERKVFLDFDPTTQPYGLFTSASNVVLIPKGFAKPTDHMESVKLCFYKRHLDLYGNNLVGINNLRESCIPSWFSEIQWLEPPLPQDWKRKIDKLLNYRANYLERKYSAFSPSERSVQRRSGTSGGRFRK